MKVLLKADGHPEAGGSALVLHNERLADPLDPVVRLLGSYTGKRKKTEADHMEIARIEFFGGLYMSDPITVIDGELVTPAGSEPILSAWMMLRCLQTGATRHKRGADVLRGVHPETENGTLAYDEGPRDPEEMWKSGKMALRKTVGVQRQRTMRTRPMFRDWVATLPIEVDPVIFDLDTLANLWADAGRYAGLGEMRPVYGRFAGTIERVSA